jgi:hypothetical protein
MPAATRGELTNSLNLSWLGDLVAHERRITHRLDGQINKPKLPVRNQEAVVVALKSKTHIWFVETSCSKQVARNCRDQRCNRTACPPGSIDKEYLKILLANH